jgi:hypothetical protein
MVLPGEPEYEPSFALSPPGLPQHGQQPAGQLKLSASSNRLGLDKDQGEVLQHVSLVFVSVGDGLSFLLHRFSTRCRYNFQFPHLQRFEQSELFQGHRVHLLST